MDRRFLPLATLVVGLAIGAGVALWLAPSEPASTPPPAAADLEVALVPAEDNPEGLPHTPPEGLLPPEAETHPEYFEDLEGRAPEDVAPESMPAEIEFARLEKLSAESDVPHEMVGAWDEAPESSTPGQRRAFVVVVKPDIGDAALEALARDLRDQNRDARVLNVRIFDSEEGARRAAWVDGGALAYRHLVAQVNVNEGLGLDVIRVRGRRIEP